ncbi:hypothetical protein CRENBAI_018530 [Crenichthys baileyi]|uniref:Uncharacterized protein n=1 Tax=Crenichthys baileyi TaxID=28760 RepID=A0AAV9RZX2_9TELE
MILQSSCLHFGPTQNHIMTVGTSHQDQADKAQELKKWVRQQEEELRKMHGEEVERSSVPPTVSATSTFSHRRRHHRGPSSSPTTTAVSPSASSTSSTSAANPAAAEFPAGYGSRPGRHRRHKTVTIGEFRMGASRPSTEGPPATIPSQLFSPALSGGHSAPSAVLQPLVQSPALNWIQAGLEEMKKKFMKERCCGLVLHLMDHPEDLNLVHSVLQAEFIAEGWLDAPAPLSAGGPFDPLLVAVRAAQNIMNSDSQHAAKPLASQYAPKPLDSQHAAGSTEAQPGAVRIYRASVSCS